MEGSFSGGSGKPGDPKLPPPKRAQNETALARFAWCHACPTGQFFKNAEWDWCRKCNCNLEQKILVANAFCPDGHWKAEEKAV